MSVQVENSSESNRASTALVQKAVSFKNNLRLGIIRKTSNVKSDGVTPKINKKPALTRSGSFNDGGKIEKVKKKSEVEILKDKEKGVVQAIRYVQDVVNKGITEQLAGSVSVLLEVIMDIDAILENHVTNSQSMFKHQSMDDLLVLLQYCADIKPLVSGRASSILEICNIAGITVLTSAHRGMLQSLSDLLTCTDRVVLGYSTTFTGGNSTGSDVDQLDSGVASAAISTFKESLENLIALVERHLSPRSHSEFSNMCPQTAAVVGSVSLLADDKRLDSRSLAERSPLNKCRNVGLSQSAGNLLDDSGEGESNNSLDVSSLLSEPPPKPPLPLDSNGQLLLVNRSSYTGVNQVDTDGEAPPLPIKQRNSSGAVFSSLSSASHIHAHTFRFSHLDTSNQSGLFLPSLDSTSQTGSASIPSVRESSASSLCSLSPSGSASEIEKMEGEPPPKPPLPLSFSTSPRVLQTRTSQYDNVVDEVDSGSRLDSLNCDSAGVSCDSAGVDEVDYSSQGNIRSHIKRFESIGSDKPRTSETSDQRNNSSVGSESSRTESQFSEANRFWVDVKNGKQDSYSSEILGREKGDQCHQAGFTRQDFNAVRIPLGFRGCGDDNQNDVAYESREMNLLTVDSMRTVRSCSPSEGVVIQRQQGTMVQKRVQCLTMFGGPTGTEGVKPQGSAAPPVPPKRKNVDAYMQMLEMSRVSEISRHSAMDYHIESHRKLETLSISIAVPNRSSDFAGHSFTSTNKDALLAEAQPPDLPPKQRSPSMMTDRSLDSGIGSMIGSNMSMLNDENLSQTSQITTDKKVIGNTDPAESPNNTRTVTSTGVVMRRPAPAVKVSEENTEIVAPHSEGESYENKMAASVEKKDDVAEFESEVLSTLDLLDVSSQLIYKKPGEEGPDIRGGSVDALIVYATAPQTQTSQGFNVRFFIREMMPGTYPQHENSAFNKLLAGIYLILQRKSKFSSSPDPHKKKLARYASCLLIRVTDELCTETDEQILQILLELVRRLLCDGERALARSLRKKVLVKCEYHRRMQEALHQVRFLSERNVTSKKNSVTEFKSQQIAEQMTLIDAYLFQKIEMPEVLLWSREQSEEHSPNLTQFTEHFNKMSYWCRTKILETEDSKEREKVLMKFIKVMKHLRQLNNFNSYLAILSALDSAPVRRLEWAKQNVEALKEYCELIDSSASFRAYRQVVEETEPPCIPYIGLVLQDLTFIHIGNPDKFPDGNINFAKCCQVSAVLDKMKKFRKCDYNIKKNNRVVDFFNNFDDYLCEESLWQISEMIKPRGAKKNSIKPDN